MKLPSKPGSLLLLISLIVLLSCKKNEVGNTEDPAPVTTDNTQSLTNMVTGAPVQVATVPIGSTGGSIKIAKPGTPVDGMEIAIPAKAYASGQNFKVSYSEIKSHNLGTNFNPVSPMITVTSDLGYSSELMSITIPIKITTGQIPLGFYLDDTTGKLEGIPVLSYTANSVTLLTRHFLSANKLKKGELNLKAGTTSTGGANIVISSISESILNGMPIIASGFKPGTDDWEFVNYGSYIAPGGHCAGQNMAAMWYYYEKKASEGKLFNKFSDNPKLWHDNARGYRFCSVIHQDLVGNGLVTTLFDKYIDRNQEFDKLKLLTIAGAMLVTGEPQGIGIYYQDGTKADGTPTYAGHDLICYQASVSAGKLYISDPNTPGTEQFIEFANNKFKPYLAKLKGGAPATPFPYVTYYAKTAYIEWNKIGKRWDEVLNNTIGTVAPNLFPAYTIWAKSGAGFELKDGTVMTKDSLLTNVVCPTAEVFYNIQNQKLIGMYVFNQNGIRIDKALNKYTSLVKLTPGLNKLGYCVIGWRSISKDINGNYDDLFVDFKWITVNYVPLSIITDQPKGQPAKEVKFTALTNGAAPKSAKFVWNFGDGSAAVTKVNDSTAVHTFDKAGIYTIKTELFDNSNGTKITEISTTYEVAVQAVSGNFTFTYDLPSKNYYSDFTFRVTVTGSIESKTYTIIGIAILNGFVFIDLDRNAGITKPDFKLTFSFKIAAVNSSNKIVQPSYTIDNILNVNSFKMTSHSENNSNAPKYEYAGASGIFQLSPIPPQRFLGTVYSRFSYDYNEVITYSNTPNPSTKIYGVELDLGAIYIEQKNNW